MSRPRRLIPSLKVFAIISSVVFVLSGSNALAQGSRTGQGDDPVRKYVLMAPGTWTDAQDHAVQGVGGTVEFSHAASGIGVVTSANPDFFRQVMRTGAIGRGAEDVVVQWQSPANDQLADDGVVEEVITAGDDRFINALWNIGAINAPGAWAAGAEGVGVRVAVIDGGMCNLHPDIAPNLDVAASRSFVPGFNYNDDTGGATAFRHACHVAGIIAAVDNTIGTIGVAPKATIIACKALHGGSGDFGGVIEAILYASDPISAGGAGAHIINMSLGATFAKGGGNTGAGPLVAAMNKAVNYATENNVLVVTSAGNNAIDMDHSGNITNVPAQSGSAIAVSATAPANWVGNPPGSMSEPASYTNYGHQLVWVSAPGGDSDYPGNENCAINLVSPAGSLVRPCWVYDLVLSPGSQSGSYFFASGTSMAAPHVSGVAALIAGMNPGISVGDLKTRIAQTADDAGATGADPYHGHGFVNAMQAVTAGTAAPAVQRQVQEIPTGVELVISRNAGNAVPTISFAMPGAGPARVDLFDVAGRNVAVLFDGVAPAGRTTLSWDGSGSDGQSLGNGAYFARITAGGVRAARRLILLGQ